MARVYYWTYRDHPQSPNENFLYDGIIFVPEIIPNGNSDDYAHRQSKEIISNIADSDQSVKHDLGIHLISPIDKLVREKYDIEEITDQSQIDEERMKQEARNEISEQDILDVADRQERFELHDMGEDVDGIIGFEK